MKHHRTERSIALKTKEELARELDRLLDTDIHNIADKNRWILDMDPADVAVMSMRETQYAIFELKAAKSQDKAVEERTHRETKNFKHYCNMPGICVPTMKVFKHEGCIEEERDKKTRERNCRNKKRSKSSRQIKRHIKQI